MSCAVPRALLALIIFVTASQSAVSALVHDSGATTNHRQDVWFDWDKYDLKVLVIPPEHGQLVKGGGLDLNLDELDPCDNTYMDAIRASMDDWLAAVSAFSTGEHGLSGKLSVERHILTCEASGARPPDWVWSDADIVITTDQTKLNVLGVAVRPPDPTGTVPTCIVDNSKLFIDPFTQADMYNVNGQEYGHCLGLNHSLGPTGDSVIAHDIMNGAYADKVGTTSHIHCISNLNVAGLELVFDGIAQPTFVERDPRAYQTIRAPSGFNCASPGNVRPGS